VADPVAAPVSHRLTARARAKINLSLHVLGRRADGYHELESLVAFADEGDELSLVPGPILALALDGPEASSIGGDPARNLVARAVVALSRRVEGLASGHFRLTKYLPVASGIGGGSSDAAAALRLLAEANGIPSDAAMLREVAAELGADVPVCLDQVTRIMRGTGADLAPPASMTAFPAVLVNPRVPVETAAVFGALGLAPGERCGDAPDIQPPDGLGCDGVIAALQAQRNDLTAPAVRVAPAIAGVLGAVGNCRGCLLARMSGSGATVFGLFGTREEAAAAAERLAAENEGWWVRATMIGR
jgi:4-diphosphocytidyl-2-C-methyl-D-erythritol kinase